MSTLGKRKDREGAVEEPKSHGSTLFISNLPYTATSTDVKTLFSDIAPVRNAFVVLEQGSGSSKGVGYVSFAIKEDAQLALTKISTEGLNIDGRSIRAQWAENKPKDGAPGSESKPRPMSKHPAATNNPKDPLAIRTVVISGLSPSVDAKSLWKKIRKYDGADKVEWPLKTSDGEDPTSAHALFSNATHAQAATQKLHAHIFKGSMISAALKKRLDGLKKPVAASTPSQSNSKSTSAPSRANRLIVRNIPFDINEQDITSAFLPHGPIHSVDIPRAESGKAQGFAFVWMLSRNDAEQAMSKCNGMKIRAGMAEELARMKQKKKKEMREEKKGRAGEIKEEGETTSGAERVIAVDWALSKAKWEQEKAKVVEDGDIEMGESDNQASEDDNDDEDEAIGVNEDVSDSDNERLSDDDEENQPKPGRPELPPPESGTTLFVRNIPFEATEDELRLLFRSFGPLRYARITMDANTGRSRGTGFVCFWNKEDADKAVEKSDVLRLETTGTVGIPKSNPFKLPSILTPDPSSSLAQDLVLHGRTLDVVQAVTRNEATKLKEEGEKRREKADKRNLYLLREGVILPNTPAAETLPPTELEKRTQSFNTRRALLNSNPSLYVSKTRLSIRQLPTGVTEHMLKRLANYAIREFEEEVKEKVRVPLDEEELNDHPEEQKPTKKKKVSGKVKQAKVVRQQDKVDPLIGKGKSKGYGFLELHEHGDALRVLRWANNNTGLAPLWAKWWKEEVPELIEKAQKPVSSGEKDNDKDTAETRVQRLKEELKKDDSGRWTTKGTLTVEFSIENIQVTQRRKTRESEVNRTDQPRNDVQAKMEDDRPSKKRKLQNQDERTDGVPLKQKGKVEASAHKGTKQLGHLIGRKRKQRTRS